MSATSRLYGILLKILPCSFRERYGAEMQRMFEEQWRDGSAAARARQLLRAQWDLVFTAIHVRLFSSEYEAPTGSWDGGGRGQGIAAVAFELRLALRALRREPLFAVTAAGTLALGIGATTAVFSVVDATVLRALRVPVAERVVSLWSTFTDQGTTEFALSPAEFTDLRTDVRALELVGGYGTSQATLVGLNGGAARTLNVAYTTGDLYEILGAETPLGRLPGRGDDQIGAQAVAVLSHGLWADAYGGDAAVVGTRTIRVGTAEALIIGVLSPESRIPDAESDVWVHWVLDPATWASDRSGHSIETMARLAPGASLAAVRAELAALERTWEMRYAGRHTIGAEGHGIAAAPLSDRLLGSTRRVGWLLAAASLLLLVLACANVANLLLARGETRAGETGVRMALGAGPGSVGRPILVEGVVLAVLGGAGGILLAALGLPLLLRAAPAGIGGLEQVGTDLRVLSFSVVISLAAGIFFSVAPAVNAMRRDPAHLLRTGGRGRTSVGRGLRILVAGQTAIATMLLAMAGLLTRSLLQLSSVDAGFEAESRVALELTLPADRFATSEPIVAFYDAVVERVRGLPGVQSSTVLRALPLHDSQRNEYVLREGDSAPGGRRGVVVQTAGADYARALGIPLVEGRDLSEADRADAAHVVLVNRTAARTWWPGEPAVGKRIRPMFAPESWGAATVVGVLDDVRGAGLAAEPAPEVVLPIAQMPGWSGWIRTARLVVHGTGPTAAIVDAVRRAIREIDAAVPVESPRTLEQVVRASTARERFVVLLLQAFAALALTIAAVGVFGVVSFTVARQSRELAIRNALGADRGTLLRRVLRGTLVMSGAGAALGTALVLLTAPALAAFLYGVAPRDTLILVGVPAALVILALLSSLAPAVRAARIAPVTLLKE